MDNKTNKIKELRLSKKISRQELAEGIGISVSSIESYELGRRVPSLETWFKLAGYFGVSVPYLTGSQNLEYITGDTNLLTNMDESPNMMQQAKLEDTKEASVAFNRVLSWLDNAVLDSNTKKPIKSDNVHDEEKKLIADIKSTFSNMRDTLMIGRDYAISDEKKYIKALHHYQKAFEMIQKFSKLDENDRSKLLIYLENIEESDQNKKASDDKPETEG